MSEIQKMLCPPGNGVFTVHTAKELKDELHQSLYQTTNQEEIETKWKESIANISSYEGLALFGITLDTGGGIQRGANWGPLFLRKQLLGEDISTLDLGDTKTIPHLIHDKYLNQETITNCQKALYGEKNNLPVSALSIAEKACDAFFSNPRLKLLSLGGDHSVSYPLVKSWLQAKKKQNKRVAIIHFDAHTDLMDSRLGVDICFATWAKKIIPYLDKSTDLIQLGIRSSGSERSHWESNCGVQQYWTSEIKNKTPKVIADQICDYLKEQNIEQLYLSFDIDALDSKYASATGTPEDEGLDLFECITLIENICKDVELHSCDLVEVAPFVSSYKKNPTTPEPETTLLSSKMLMLKMLEIMNR